MRKLPKSRAEVDRLTRQLVDALDRLGCAYKRKDGSQQLVAIRRRLLTESGGILLLEVDTERLPRGVKARQLTHRETLHHLTAVLHCPVKVLNTTGVTYALLLDPPSGAAADLPRRAELGQALTTWDGRPYTLPLGEGASGPVWAELAGHYLVGGETGSGKTTWVLGTALALARLNDPEKLRLAIADPKGVDFLPLLGLPHLLRPVAVTTAEVEELTAWAAAEIDRRRAAYLSTLARDLDQHNSRAEQALPRVVLIIDEVVMLALQAGLKSAFYRDLITLASVGRAFGIHLILATQNPKAEVLNTLIRGNLAGRLAFKVTTATHSRVILGRGGAEALPAIPGRFLALGAGLRGLCQLQAYHVTAEELAAIAQEAGGGALVPDQDGRAAGGTAAALSLLDSETRQMVEYALSHLNGRFGQEDMMNAGFRRRPYRRAVNKLKALGLLYNDPDQNNALVLALGRLDQAEQPTA